MKIMATGDLHIGRAPSRLPESLSQRADELGPSAVWNLMVEQAIEKDVKAVVLAGDVVEEESDFFEAYRILDEGIRRLVRGGIKVFAVAGNHDVRVLPRLADQIDDFHLLGRGGEWESCTLQEDTESLTLHGWSFNTEKVIDNPLREFHSRRGAGVNLGLLHCDRDQSGSVYAPVSSAELKSAGLDCWLLGHIHVPERLTPELPIGYLGSAVGLDPGEPGDRGPWLLELAKGRITAIEHFLIAPLHWDRLTVDVSSIQEPEDVRGLLLKRIDELSRDLTARALPPAAAGLRVEFTGRSDLRGRIQELFESQHEALENLYSGEGRTQFFIERLSYSIQPALDMADLARRSDPPGLLARQLLKLEGEPEDPERRELLAKARARLAEQAAKPWWRTLGDDSQISEEKAAEWLRQAGLAALDKLLSQEEKK